MKDGKKKRNQNEQEGVGSGTHHKTYPDLIVQNMTHEHLKQEESGVYLQSFNKKKTRTLLGGCLSSRIARTFGGIKGGPHTGEKNRKGANPSKWV